MATSPTGVTVEALSTRTQGANPRTIKIDPMDIQEEFEILPEEGSTLADDDQFRGGRLMQLFQLAMAAPNVFNVRSIAAKLLQVFPGANPEEDLAPPPQQPPPPPPKIAWSISSKVDLAPDVQEALLAELNLPTQGQKMVSTIQHAADAVQHVGRAANAAADLEQPSTPSPDEGDGKTPTPPNMKGNSGS